MGKTSDEETLQRFVLRARRVQAHSIVQAWDELLRHARVEWDGHLDLAGRMTITRRLPPDEEVFESLASRLRPLTVKSEPIYYLKVFDAIERVLGDADVDERLRAQQGELRRAWDVAEIQGTQVQAYEVQSARVDGTEATSRVSDTQLAAAWMYADLVHADAQGAKQDALAFPLTERYAAAVRVFSSIAVLTVETMHLISLLQDAGHLRVSASAWEDDVTIGASELVEEVRAFVAPLGSEMPDMRDSREPAGEWSAFTVTELLRQEPAKHVRVVLREEGGGVIASYDAAVSRRQSGSVSAAWNVLVAGSVIFQFSFDLQGEQIADVNFLGWEIFDSTSELKLASTRLRLQLHQAAAMVVEVGGREVLALDVLALLEVEQRELEVVAQTLEDVVTIERLTRQTLQTCNGRLNDCHRVQLRRARLMLEGQIVHTMRYPVIVTAPDGIPPQAIVIAAGTLHVDGAEIPIPQSFMRHPAMTATEIGAAPQAGPNAKTYRMAPPDGQQFLAWVPGRAEVSGDDDLVTTAPWNLIGIDEDTFND